jgi:hypothetical protein
MLTILDAIRDSKLFGPLFQLRKSWTACGAKFLRPRAKRRVGRPRPAAVRTS